MDLKTSRRPPAVPRFIAVGDRLALATADAFEARVTAMLDEPRYPDQLVLALGAPRLAVQEAVARLCRGGGLDTPRAAYARQHAASPWRVGRLPLEVALGLVIEGEQRAGLVALGAEASVGAVLDALAVPLVTALDRLWAGFVEHERFARRAAFGLPDEPEVDQAERFSRSLLRLFEALSERTSERERLARIVDGAATIVKVVEVVGVFEIASAAPGDRLTAATAAGAVAVLGGEAGHSSGLQDHRLTELFVHDRACLTGRGGPRPLPSWLAELNLRT